MKKIKHYIIVKFKNDVNKQALVKPIKELFQEALKIKGVSSIDIMLSNSNLLNRHDIMIQMTLTNDALKVFDNSEIHKKWKENYSKYIIDKTIFDCDYKDYNSLNRI